MFSSCLPFEFQVESHGAAEIMDILSITVTKIKSKLIVQKICVSIILHRLT